MAKQNSNIIFELAADVARRALTSSYETVVHLGDRGTEIVQRNQFGDTAVLGDVAAEEAVIRELEASGLRVTLYSEEHGKLEVNQGSPLPQMLGVLDGIDGSSEYARDRKGGNYGTMFALLAGQNPSYDDYIAVGVVLPVTANLYLAVKGKGITITDLRTGRGHTPHISRATKVIPGKTRAYVDTFPTDSTHPLHGYFVGNYETFARPLAKIGVGSIRLASSAVHYTDLAAGRVDLVGESTRKGNLEFAIAYGLIKEAGGVMMTTDGKDIGTRRFLHFGQDGHVPILTAANMQLAEEILLSIKEDGVQ